MSQKNVVDTTNTSSNQPSKNTLDERYHTLFEQVNGAAFLTSLNGQILEANQRSVDLLGYEWEELLRLSLKNLFHEDTDWESLMDEIAARGGHRFESENICKNGDFLPVEVSISLFRMQGKPVMFVLIWDITDRKNAERKLREREKQFRSLFEYTIDGIMVLDARGNILQVNTKLCQMLDFTKEELTGNNVMNLDLLTARSMPVVVSQFEELLSQKTTRNYTTEIKTRAGAVLTVEVSSFFLVKKDNEVDNFVVMLRDITDRLHTEKKLMLEHDLLDTLMNNIPDSIYFKDEENRFIMVNKAKAAHSGVTPDEMVGKTDFDFLSEEEARQASEDDTRIMQTGHPVINKVEKITHKNSSERWVSVTKVPRFNADGDIIGTVGISRDISEQEQAKKELIVSKERYQNIFENSSFAIIVTDENGRVVQWNKLAKKLLSMDDSDLHLRPVKSLYPPEEWSKIKNRYGSSEGQNQRLETRLMRKDKQELDVDLTVNMISDDSGYVLGSTEIIHDITKRKKVEKELMKHHELLYTLMEHIPDSIYFKDEQNRFILVNKAKADHWHVTPDEMVGKTDFDFLPTDAAQRAFDDDSHILKTGEPVVDKIEKITGSDGLTRWFSVTKVPMYDTQGAIIGTMGISRNVTEWKRLETMKQDHLQ